MSREMMRRRRTHPTVSALLLSAAMLALCPLMVALHPGLSTPWLAAPWWAVGTLALAFGATEHLMFTIEYRRHAFAFTMSELPTAVAVMYLGLGPAIAARLVGSLIVIVLTNPPNWVKLVFNACLFTLEMTATFFVLHNVMGAAHGQGARFVVGMVAALMTATIIDSVLVSAVISFFEPGQLARFRAELPTILAVTTVSSVNATLVAAFSISWPYLTAIGSIPVAAVWVMQRNQARTIQRLRDLEALQELSARLSRSLHAEEVSAIAIDEVQNLMRSERAALVLFRADTGAATVQAFAGAPFDGLPTRIDDPRWQAFIAAATPILIERNVFESLGIPLGSASGNLIVAPIRDEVHTIGLLIVAERGGQTSKYVESDITRAASIADRVGVALRNAQLHEQIENEAWHDSLTGLPNRTSFERFVDEELADVADDVTVAVLMVDLDHFKEVNAALGHTFGDKVLVELTARLSSFVGAGDVVARVAGDEFAVMYQTSRGSVSHDLAASLREVLQQPYRIDEVDVVLGVNIGVAVSVTESIEADTLLRQASIAMEWAKSHHTSIEVYRSEIDGGAPERLALLTDLRVALEHRELDVHFQPKVDLVSGVVVGAEALVRWEHAKRGFVAPLDFIELAEATGLISQITDQVLTKTVAAIRLFNDLGYRLNVAVNLSTIDLIDETLVDRVRRCLAAERVDAEQLTLEITETALLTDGPRALATAEELQRLGVKLSIDDFGTGFSSLSYLRMLPAHELKVDRSFVTTLLSDDRDEVIVRSTIELGHTLGLQVTAEGIEDDATLERLRSLGCDLGQGFGISRPLPLHRFLGWLNAEHYAVARHEQAEPALALVVRHLGRDAAAR